MATPWTLQALDLRTPAFNLIVSDDWDTFAGKKGNNVDVAFVPGDFSDPVKFLKSKEWALHVMVGGLSAAGTITHPAGSPGHLRDNVDQLMALLAGNSLLDLRRTVTDVGAATTHERQALVECLDAVPVKSPYGPGAFRSFVLDWKQPWPYWRQMAQKTDTEAGITTTSHVYSIATGGNADIYDAEIDFSATSSILNPRLTVTSTGQYIQYSGTVGAGMVLTVKLPNERRGMTATLDGLKADAGLSRGFAWGLFLPSASPTLSLTATVSGASNYDIDIRWYDQWL
jgi:hypothetical protein